ncbi:MAG TPA: hypothetical protein VIB48_01470 [Acidimicrobiia bacterium]
MTAGDTARSGALHPAIAAEMATLLRESADTVEELAGCGDARARLALWQQLASHMARFDTLLPEELPL